MIKVLRSLTEVERAIGVLQKEGCGYHADRLKNWDLAQINDILRGLEKDARILDMGCGGSEVLKFCCRRGFVDCVGVDLSISLEDRLKQVQMMIKKKTWTPYRLLRGDLTKTNFPSNSFDFIICLSVIEHGVDINSFLREAGRLLKSEGILFVSADYWEPKILTSDVPNPLGLNWNIFSKKEIQGLVDMAKTYDLRIQDEDIPPTKDRMIRWNRKGYTAISLIFTKTGSTDTKKLF